MDAAENVSTNGSEPYPVQQYRHSLTWRERTPELGAPISLDISGESLMVRACFGYLSSLPQTLWGDFEIAHEDRRVLAARWLAQQIEGVEECRRRTNP